MGGWRVGNDRNDFPNSVECFQYCGRYSVVRLPFVYRLLEVLSILRRYPPANTVKGTGGRYRREHGGKLIL